jgi:hypothetical protein
MALNLTEKHSANFRGKGNQNNQLWIQIKKKSYIVLCENSKFKRLLGRPYTLGTVIKRICKKHNERHKLDSSNLV